MTTWGGATRDMIGLGVAGLYAMDPSGHSSGMYLTGGAGLVLVNNGFNSGTNLSIGGGVGWRKPFGSAAWRYELGFRYDTKNNAYLPATIRIGGRVGLSPSPSTPNPPPRGPPPLSLAPGFTPPPGGHRRFVGTPARPLLVG